MILQTNERKLYLTYIQPTVQVSSHKQGTNKRTKRKKNNKDKDGGI